MIFVSRRACAFLASWYSAFSLRSPNPRAVLISSAIAARAGPSSSASEARSASRFSAASSGCRDCPRQEPTRLDPIQPPDAERNRHRGRDRRRSGARRAGRHGGARGRRPAGDPRRPGARGVARRAGVLVARRPVPRRLPGAAAPADPRLARARAGRTGSAPPASTARRTSGRAAGPRPTSTSRRARSARGCTRRACGSCPTSRWAERGGYLATGHGNSVPRFHVTWGTGPGVLEPFVRRVRAAQARGLRRAALPPPGRRADVERRRGRPACAARCSSPATCERGQQAARARPSATFALDARRP